VRASISQFVDVTNVKPETTISSGGKRAVETDR